MKKYLFLLLSLAAITVLNGCKKNTVEIIGPDGGTSAATYQPLTSGSTWTYVDGITPQANYTTTTLTGATAVINNKTYYTTSSTSAIYTGAQTGYMYTDGHIYSLRGTTLVYGVTLNMIYLNDSLPVGAAWVSKVTDSGLINSVPAQTVGKIVAANISKTVLGKTYNDVIHSQVDLQYDYGSGFTSTTVYDFYIARGVGVIEIDSNLSLFGFSATATSLLSSYSIK